MIVKTGIFSSCEETTFIGRWLINYKYQKDTDIRKINE